ncbi:MAG: hypothetical protein Q7J27_10115 [Syntrophales bacterium]|nr:hypothetical protein [Syntrophales bacterium]
MDDSQIGMSCNGAIKLGRDVTCDGFVAGYKYRVQTHIHEDHMCQFDCSKGFQTIIMSEATKSFLELRHLDITARENVVSLPIDGTHINNGIEIQLLSSGHMLGAVQVEVTTSTGDRLGYSGDFSWPLERVIQVESLVLDSTYGDPRSIRHYSQEDANDYFKEIILRRIKRGPIIIKGHRGTLYRAFELLNELVPNPVIANKKKIEEAKVCEKQGYCVCSMYDLDLPDVKKMKREETYIGLYYMGEQIPYDRRDVTVINLTAHWVHGIEPFLEISDTSYQIAVSDHADFNETLEYVRATGAKVVLTDSLRSNHAKELASAIRRSLGINAKAAKPIYSREWGV